MASFGRDDHDDVQVCESYGGAQSPFAASWHSHDHCSIHVHPCCCRRANACGPGSPLQRAPQTRLGLRYSLDVVCRRTVCCCCRVASFKRLGLPLTTNSRALGLTGVCECTGKEKAPASHPAPAPSDTTEVFSEVIGRSEWLVDIAGDIFWKDGVEFAMNWTEAMDSVLAARGEDTVEWKASRDAVVANLVQLMLRANDLKLTN